jgi:hypothetical protein
VVIVGVTATAVTPTAPVLHTTVPVQFFTSSVTLSPGQMFSVLQVTSGFSGLGVTVTVVVAGALSQVPILQVAEYVVVPVGVTTTLLPVAPVLQVTVPPAQPVAVSVTLPPAHTVPDGDAAIVTGCVLLPTLTVTLAGALSHLPVAPLHEAW